MEYLKLTKLFYTLGATKSSVPSLEYRPCSRKRSDDARYQQCWSDSQKKYERGKH
jgi:hypothetical protein